jgi:hypothetical protein
LAYRQARDAVLSGGGARRLVLSRRLARRARDFEFCGTAIEMSLTGTFQLILHKQNSLSGSLAGLNYPLLETQDERVLRGFSFPIISRSSALRRSRTSTGNPRSISR